MRGKLPCFPFPLTLQPLAALAEHYRTYYRSSRNMQSRSYTTSTSANRIKAVNGASKILAFCTGEMGKDLCVEVEIKRN